MKRITFFTILTIWLFAAFSVSAQNRGISGVVSDKNGLPIPGVAVMVKGGTVGVTTDADGRFTIQVPQGATLQFSFMGYTPQERPVGDATTLNVTLDDATVGLDEVIVVGYGTQSKRTVTSAISKVSGDELQDAPINSVGDGLKGKIAGAHFYSTNNTPGAEATIRIRGGSSINRSNEPLILVDGVERDLSGINPNDIASIEVLKDAASSAIYGSRASNGVVLVTTKRGSNNAPRITFEASWALEQPERTYEFLGAEDYISYVRTAVSQGPHPDYNFKDGYSASSGNTSNSIYSTRYLEPGESVPVGYKSMIDPIDPTKTLIFQDNSFVDEVFKNALWQNYYVGLDGGSDVMKYAASIGYTDDSGVAVGTNFSRFSARMNADVKINKRLKFIGGVDFGQTLTNAYASQYQVISRGLYCPPTQRLYNDDGTPTPGYNASSPSPLYYAYLNDNDQKFNKLALNGGLDWDIIDGLKATFQASLYTAVLTGDNFTRANKFNGSRPASTTLSDTQRKKFETYIAYNKTFNEVHSLSAMAGYSYQRYNYKSVRAAASGASSDKIPTLNAAPTKTDATSVMEEQVMIGYFGRINYDYKRKYMLTLTFREDGSSLFAKGNQWGFFPGASAGWAISDEPFMQNARSIDNMKLRVSYGQTGNNSIGLYDALGQYSVDTKYDGGAGILPTAMPNQGLTWETSTQIDVGLDLAMFNNSIQVSVDYFNKDTENLLFSKTLPNTSGFGSVLTNVGKVRFSGFDLEVSTRNIHTDNFRWDSRLTWSYVKNKVLELPDNGRDKNRIGGYSVKMADGSTYEFGGTAEGEELYRFYGYHTDYIIETMEQADAAPFDELSRGWRVSDMRYVAGRKDVGDYQFKDLNGDGRINGQDMFFMGTIMPHSTGGLNNTFSYKNFTLNIFMDWALGHSICDQILSRQFVNFFANNSSLSKEVLKTWKTPGDGAKYARFSGNDSDDTNRNFRTVSNVFTQKADYLCLREVSLVYNVPTEKLQKFGIHGLAITLAGNNLHYFTDVIGISPETGTSSTYGSAYFSYPPIRRVSLGLRVTF